MNRFKIILTMGLVLFLLTLGITVHGHHAAVAKATAHEAKVSQIDLPKDNKKSKSDLAADEDKNALTKKGDSKSYDWKKSSENKPYPDPKLYPNLTLQVSIADQRVYVMDGTKKLYTMHASTGSKKSPTPTGTFHIQRERGKFFYNAQSKEGAKYYVSFKDHGIYLFHTVPTDQNGKYIPEEAEQLGKEANSHGCVRLAVPDAKWIYYHVTEGTKVEIH